AHIYAPGDEPASEDTSAFPTERASYYLASKLSADVFLEHLRQSAKLPVTTLRLTSVFGPGMLDKSGAARLLAAAAAGDVLDGWGGGLAKYDWIFIEDVVKAILAAVRIGPQGVYNVGSGRSHTVLEFAETAAEVYADAEPRVQVRPPEGRPDRGFRPIR